MQANKHQLVKIGCPTSDILPSITLSAAPGGCAPGPIQAVQLRFMDPAQRCSCQP